MINKNIIRNNIELLKKALKNRNNKTIDVDLLKDLDNKLANVSLEIESLNRLRNELAQKANAAIKNKDEALFLNLKKEGETIKNKLELLKADADKLEQKLQAMLYEIPNIPHASVPVGVDENDNVEVKRWGQIPKFDFAPIPHWDLITNLKLGDFERATKVSGSRFFIYKGLGNKLIRALQAFTLDHHEKSGYIEFGMPVIVNEKSLIGTGQLPKFKEDLFKIENTNYYLSPTLEVQLTNYYAQELLDEAMFPIKIAASSLNFRSEAGSAGKDTRGIIRQHQFYKTEMVNLALPENSYEALELMTTNAEMILEALNLPYRRIVLCTGDMGFGAAKTYDIEVYLPSYNGYKEISSCSNCEDFQARRAMIRYKNSKTNKNELVHTLNGSGLAIDRLFAAVIENYQNQDGSINVPTALQKYMGVAVIK
ncbi:MAG: serine--tRNA ligase [Malacoplasma sp.]|nr:serine--tRNA ligase [Malacoplasma sp.]